MTDFETKVLAALEKSNLTEDKIMEIMYNFGLTSTINYDLAMAAGSMHLIMCKRNHDTDCKFYDEEQMDKEWSREYHRMWYNKAETLMKDSGIDDPEEFLDYVRKAYGIFCELGVNSKLGNLFRLIFQSHFLVD